VGGGPSRQRESGHRRLARCGTFHGLAVKRRIGAPQSRHNLRQRKRALGNFDSFTLSEAPGIVQICRIRQFMEEVIIAILQAVFEFVLEIFSFVPFDWPSRSRSSPESDDVGLNCFYWFVIGCGLACSSMLFLRHTWISLSILRLANLVLAPIVSAFISRAIARRRSRHNPNINPRKHFWQAFWFTLGVVSVRFAYAIRH